MSTDLNNIEIFRPYFCQSVLVIDSDGLNRALVAEVLKDAGYAVCVADDVSSAIVQIKGEIPDMVIATSNIEGVDGAEIVAELRRIVPAMCKTPAILITDLELGAGRSAQLSNQGFRWILQTPIVPTSLPKLVDRTVGERYVGHLRRPVATERTNLIPFGCSASAAYMCAVV